MSNEYLIVMKGCGACEQIKKQHPDTPTIDIRDPYTKGMDIVRALDQKYVPFKVRLDGDKVFLLDDDDKVIKCNKLD